MNKAKKNDTKKILVRNTERPVPKTKLIVEGKPECRDKTNKNEPKANQTKIKENGSKFSVPELNSTLKISKKMEMVEKTKSQKNLKICDVAFNERATRKINFPIDKPIYKDLIPLQVPAKSPTIPSSREPLPQKDKEPVLSTYAKENQPKEFLYQPSIKLETQSLHSQFSTQRLYKLMQIHQ